MSKDQVGAYYDASTRRFLAVGGSGSALAIHRGLWAEGITTPEAAAAHTNELIRATAERLSGAPPAKIIDLGCGVGGSVFHLAAAWPEASFIGLTLSPVQVARAEAEATARALSPRCRFLAQDFLTDPNANKPGADLAIAIESHVHAPTASAFLTAARQHLRAGGLLILVDDMVLRPEAQLTPKDQRLLARFRKGWRLGHVPDRAGLAQMAADHGFSVAAMDDLTPLIRLNRWRDLALGWTAPIADRIGLNRWPLFGNMVGGDALTQAYRRGVMGYTLMALRLDRAPPHR